MNTHRLPISRIVIEETIKHNLQFSSPYRKLLLSLLAIRSTEQAIADCKVMTIYDGANYRMLVDVLPYDYEYFFLCLDNVPEHDYR